jgi:putative transposase
METVALLGPRLGVAALCAGLDLPRATYYRHLEAQAPAARPTPARALSSAERQEVLAVLHEPRFADLAPAEVYARLLDEGRYLCSERTMYRVLAENAEVRERRDQLRHPEYKKPELLATAPNQVWSWDITKLLGPQKWTYFYLYVLLDIFSRYVVGWMVATRESAALARKLIGESCEREGIQPGQLTVHADRGPSMTSKSLALLLADLGTTKSHSRPNVSDDNPFSEAHFKTLKYRPDFPERFGSIEHARAHCRAFFEWYNGEHRHGGIGLVTPHDLHHGLAEARRGERAAVLLDAWAKHPERFPQGRPVPPALPTAVWINKPSSAAAPAEPADQRAPHGAQAGGAATEAEIVNAAVEDGITTEGGAH